MTNPKVYLAGAISGLTFDGAQEWRSEVTAALAPDGIRCFSPLRYKDYLRAEGVLEQSYVIGHLSSDRAIMSRDHWDCRTADLIFVNLLGASRVSIGTVMEIAWGAAYGKPLVVAIEPENNLHDHPMIREAINFRVPTLAEAIHVTLAIFSQRWRSEPGDTVASLDYLECSYELVVPGTKGAVKRVSEWAIRS